MFLLTGYHPDADLMSAAGIDGHPETLAPTLNQETFETNVPNLFLAGGCVAGEGDRQHLHRERPLSRREDHRRTGGTFRPSVELDVTRVREVVNDFAGGLV